MEIKELGHLVLYVRDLERSTYVYRDVLGWQSLLESEGDVPLRFQCAAFAAPTGRTHHELLLIEVGPDAAPLPKGPRIGLYHFALKVGDSDDELRAAYQDLLDPDGNEIELYVDVPGVDWKADPALFASPIKPLEL